MKKDNPLCIQTVFWISIFCCFLAACKNDAPNSGNLKVLSLSKSQSYSEIDSDIQSEIIKASEFNTLSKTKEALNILLTRRNHPDFQTALDSSISNVYQELAIAYYKKGEYYRSKIYIDTAIMIRSGIENYAVEKLAKSYTVRSQALQFLARNQEAYDDIKKAISLLENNASKDALVDCYMHLAFVYQNLGDFGQVNFYYQKAKDLNGGKNNQSLAVLLHNWGNAFGEKGDREKQAKMLNEAKEIFLSLGEKEERNALAAQLDLGVNMYYRGKVVEAKSQIINVLGIVDRSENNYFALQEDALNNLAAFETAYRNLSEGLKYYNKLLEVSTESNASNYNVSSARAYEGFGDIEAAENNFDAAIGHYHTAIKNLCIGFDTDDAYSNPSVANNLVINQVELLRILGFKADALLAQYQSTENIEVLDATLNTYKCLDELTIAIRQRFKAATSKFDFVMKSRIMYEKGTRVALQLYELTGNNKYLNTAFDFCTKNKAVVLQEGLQDENAKFAGIPENLLVKEKALKKERYLLEADILEIQNSNKQRNLKAKQDRRFELLRDYEKLIQTFEKDYPQYHQLKYEQQDALDVDDLISKLPEQTALVEFFIGTKKIYVFTLSKTGLVHHTLDKPNNLNALCNDFRMMFQNSDDPPSQKEYTVIGHDLYQALLEKPLSDLQSREEISRLIIIPDEYLLQISFDVLLTKALEAKDEKVNWSDQNIPYLLRDYAISYAYSNRILFDAQATRRVQAAVQTFAGFGMEYDAYTLEAIKDISKLEVDTTILGRGMGRLINSVPEVKGVRDILGEGEVWVDGEATKQTFIENAPKAKILHMATHGFEATNGAMNSGLIFTKTENDPDFILKAADLYAMTLNAEMTVLSACHTATGKIKKGEGVRSLARAFQFAGCNSLVATLWSVPDHSTKKLMLNFYENLNAGDAKDIALQKAKMSYLENTSPAQTIPSFWTNVIIIGDTKPLSMAD